MRADVAFDAAGTTLRGWLYTPEHGRPPFPAVVLAHGFSALKEMDLDRYAEVFAAAGLASLVYDNRNLGASDGLPRGEIDPVAQLRDYRHALTYAQSRPELDPARIGVWGTSYSGGLALMAAALDRRVRCVVSQVPYISGYDTMQRLLDADARTALLRSLEAERRAIAAGRAPTLVPVCTVPPTPAGRRSYEYFIGHKQAGNLPWENAVTLRSLDYRLEYEAMPYLERISPTPLLMIVADHDDITPTELALQAFERAREPKQLLMLRGDHYAPYQGAFDESSAAAREWFLEHLRSGPGTGDPGPGTRDPDSKYCGETC